MPRGAKPRVRNSVLLTDLLLALIVAAACLTIGWRDYLLVQGPVLLVSGAVGVWLFYVQHQFEDTYWQDARRLALRPRRAARELVPEAAGRAAASSPATSASTTSTT